MSLNSPADYLRSAVAAIRANALNAARCDWARVDTIVNRTLVSATTPADTHSAIARILHLLDDGHSFFISPPELASRRARAATNSSPIASCLIGNCGYIFVPGFTSTGDGTCEAFAHDIRQAIESLSTHKPIGWMVDLRNNVGGNMWPMLCGLSPLLGEGTVGAFVSVRGSMPWTMARGNAMVAGKVREPAIGLPASDHSADRVAVLLGPRTCSSGEAIAVSFTGRSNTRSFGQPTAGKSTANETIVLSDGAVMLVTASLFADRTGKTYGHEIVPDQAVSLSASSMTLGDEPVVRLAMEWLRL